MHRIYVSYTIPDARSNAKKKSFADLGLKTKPEQVYITDCYTIDASLSSKQIKKAEELLANPLMQSASINITSPSLSLEGSRVTHFDYAIEIGFLPGVTDNIGNTAKETLSDGAKIKFKPGQNVYSSQVFFISGLISEGDAKKIAKSLYNPLIQRATIKSFSDFKKDGGMNIFAPKVKITTSNTVLKVSLDIADEELAKLGKLGVADGKIRRGPLALSLPELKTIRGYFNELKRKPTDIELETLAQTWSEHCKHTIFSDPMDELKNGLYKTYIKAATEKIRKQKNKTDFCVSVFTDNAGGIIFDNNYILSHKVETHNTPSALDPFGGAITGIGGVNRDILGFGLGAKPIANFYGFCLADPNDQTKLYRDRELTKPMLSARRIMDGVIAGINSGGNQSGIPTPLGFLYFDSKYRGKPLVFAGTLGLTPKNIGRKKGWQKKAVPGDLIVMAGGKVGLDGIHGATFSSESLSSHSPSTAVQIGDPITQKKLSDALIKEAQNLDLYNSITDCGAGGLSSAVGEMAKEAGCEVNLDKVPLKYPGLQPWQIWISESQERMVLAVPKNKWQKFSLLMKKRGVEASVIGKFTPTDKCIIKYKNKIVMDVAMDFLHNGRPKNNLKTKKPKSPNSHSVSKFICSDLKQEILSLLSRLNITSTEFVSTQYDHEVQGSSIIKPLQGSGRANGEAAVIRPLLTSQKGVVLSYGLFPSYSEYNSYNMASCGIDSAISSAVAAGANVDYLALLDNFCWSDPENPEKLWQLKEAARACYDVAVGYGTPFISGKDSMHNNFKGFDHKAKPLKISIPPTLLISAVGIIPDITKAVSIDAKLPGDLLYILGNTENEMAGSEYFTMLKQTGGQIPHVDIKKNLHLYRNIFQAVQKDLIVSAISLNRGGLAAGLAKKLIAGNLGAEITLKNLPGNWKENYQALFSESRGRILVSVNPKKADEFEKIMKQNSFAKIGKTISRPMMVINSKNNQTIVKLYIDKALKNYKAPFKDY